MKRTIAALGAAAVLTAACGKSEAEKKAEESAKQAEQAAKNPQTPHASGQGFEAMAKSLQALAGKTPDGQKVEPVKYQDLVALLPQLDGWEQQQPSGERMTAPLPIARAEADYTKGGANIQIEIVDSGFNQLLLMPIAMFLSGYSNESSSGYEKSATVNGHPGWETWNSESKTGEVNALVGKRFLVAIEGTNLGDTRPLKDAASRMDFNRLATLK